MTTTFLRRTRSASTALVAAVSMAGCASGPTPEAASGQARLEASGNPLACGFTDPICRAYPAYVDGQEIGMPRSAIDVKAGERRLHLICLTNYTPPPLDVLRPAMRQTISTQRNVYAKLEAGRVYRVHGGWDGARCTPTVVDAASGQSIPLEDIVAY